MRLFPTSFRIALFVGCFVASADAQDPSQAKLFLSEVLEPTSKRQATYFLSAEGKDGDLFVGRIYTMDGRLKAEGRYKDEDLTIEEGLFVYYYTNGQVESKGAYAMGQKSGVWERYDTMGGALAEKVYDPNALANIIYTRAQTMPEYEGGEKALVKVIKERVVDPSGKSVKGKVLTSFVVEKNGELSDVKVVDGKNKPVDDQVVDVIRSTSPWQPGADKGVPVRVQMKIPVQF
ncbi:MAG: TonB family protein [Flavobacteriales bacterium]